MLERGVIDQSLMQVCEESYQDECHTTFTEECKDAYEEICKTEFFTDCKQEYHEVCDTEYLTECKTEYHQVFWNQLVSLLLTVIEELIAGFCTALNDHCHLGVQFSSAL